MKKIYAIFFLLFSIYSIQLKAYTFGTNGEQRGIQFIKTSDGGFLLLGQNNGATNDIYLVKVDSLIQMQWSRIIESGVPASVAEMPMGDGFLVMATGNSLTNGGAWLLRTNSLGDTLWTRTYQDATFTYYGNYIEARSLNEYIVGLSYDGPTTSNYDIFFKSDSIGSDTSFHCSGGFRGDVLPVTNGYLFTATNFGAFNGAIDVTRYDSIGNNSFHTYIADDVTYTFHFYGNSSVELVDGGFLTVGSTNFYTANSVLYEYYMIRFNAVGDSIWTRRWGVTNEVGLSGIAKITDNEFYIHGQYDSASVAHHFIWKTDTMGDTTWLMHLDASLSVSKLYMIGNGNFAVIGDSVNSSLGTKDVWFALFDSDGNPISNNNVSVSELNRKNSPTLIYPNPSSGIITIDVGFNDYADLKYKVKVSDALGRLVFSRSLDQRLTSLNLKGKVSPGIYFVTIIDSHANICDSKKLIIE